MARHQAGSGLQIADRSSNNLVTEIGSADRFQDGIRPVGLLYSQRNPLPDSLFLRLIAPASVSNRGVTADIFHPHTPLCSGLSADEGSSTDAHYYRRGTAFPKIVEMCATDSVSTTELRNGECENLSGLNRHGMGARISYQPLRRGLCRAISDRRLMRG